MPDHEIQVTLSLEDSEQAALAVAIGCTDIADLPDLLAIYGAAALREYADMLAGQPMGNATEMRERRLVSILLALPADRFPSDTMIARMFNITPGMARGLMRTTISRYRNRLTAVLDAAAKRFLIACGLNANDAGNREPRFSSAMIVEMLNERLVGAQTQHAFVPIVRKPGTFDTYVIANGSYIKLQELYP